MKFLIFLGGAFFGAVGIIAAAIYFQFPRSAAAISENDIVFSSKGFYDTGGEGRQISLVAIWGTLTGPDMAYPNNHYSIGCYGDTQECLVANVQAIGGLQIGRMDAPARYPIVKFTKAEVVAREETSDFSCTRTTFTIDRTQQIALWVEEAINQTKPACKNTKPGMRKFTIEDSPQWRKIFGKK
jgi:hypothetical protein